MRIILNTDNQRYDIPYDNVTIRQKIADDLYGYVLVAVCNGMEIELARGEFNNMDKILDMIHEAYFADSKFYEMD